MWQDVHRTTGRDKHGLPRHRRRSAPGASPRRPRRLVLTGEPPQLVDEWQLEATRVWNFVRSEVNRRGVPGQFILTGSAMPEDDARRHTGAGRVARLTMRPMSLFESGSFRGDMSLAGLLAGRRPASETLSLSEVVALLVRGGWPLNLAMTWGVEAAAQSNIDYLRNIAEIDISRVDGTGDAPRSWAAAPAVAGAERCDGAEGHAVGRRGQGEDGPNRPLDGVLVPCRPCGVS